MTREAGQVMAIYTDRGWRNYDIVQRDMFHIQEFNLSATQDRDCISVSINHRTVPQIQYGTGIASRKCAGASRYIEDACSADTPVRKNSDVWIYCGWRTGNRVTATAARKLNLAKRHSRKCRKQHYRHNYQYNSLFS